MKGKCNSGGSGGISPNDAFLQVKAPTGSIVTISKDGTSKTKDENKAFVLNERPTVSVYVFSISSSQFGTWTVTATRDTESNTDTIVINSAKDYDLYIGYHVPIGIYQEVEFLQSTGSQLMSIGYNPSYQTAIESELQATGWGQMITYGLSSDSDYVHKRGDFSADQNSSCFSMWFGGTFINMKSISSFPTDKVLLEANLSTSGIVAKLSVNGETTTKTTSFSPGNYNGMYLFGRDSLTFGKVKIYYFKVWNKSVWDSVLVRDLYPCYRLSDSVAGLYDKVNNVFYVRSSGSGSFIVGEDV